MSASPEAFTQEELEYIFKNAVSDQDYQRILTMQPVLTGRIEERILTALFSDVRNCIGLVDSLGMEASARLITDILEAIRQETITRGGFLVQFMGDAAMLVFGAPLAMDPREQARTACHTALACQERARSLGVTIGVGFNTGSSMIGCYTPRSRPTYTPMGSQINLAARLESVSQRAGNRPAIVRETRDLLEPEFRTVFLDTLSIKAPEGHKIQKEIYAVVGERAAISPDEQQLWDRYDATAAALDAGQAEQALAAAEELAASHADDSLFTTILERSRRCYAGSLDRTFQDAPDFGILGDALASACGRVFGELPVGLLEPSIDGLWRFRDNAPFMPNGQILSPDGDAMTWLRGLTSATFLIAADQPHPASVMVTPAPASPAATNRVVASPSSSAPASTMPNPEMSAKAPAPLDQLGFMMAVPIHIKNELAAVLMLGPAPALDPSVLDLIAGSFAGPWSGLREAETRERFREKVDDAAKLEEVNRELEAKSTALEQAMHSIHSLNQSLEAKVDEAVQRLARASSLKRYLPPQVVDDILDGSREMQPRTERRKLTILFSDVRGFTEATDGLEPEELARLLDEYLSAMSDIAFAAGATIDKFRGDGMMLFFGAPGSMEPREGALRCIRMAVAMCQSVERLRSEWFDQGYDWDLGVRMGINTGYATVGEFGSKDRMDYTAVGTEVNLAARLEGCCDTDSIVVSHATWALIRDEYTCVPMGDIDLKGIHRPVKLYRVAWR